MYSFICQGLGIAGRDRRVSCLGKLLDVSFIVLSTLVHIGHGGVGKHAKSACCLSLQDVTVESVQRLKLSIFY